MTHAGNIRRIFNHGMEGFSNIKVMDKIVSFWKSALSIGAPSMNYIKFAGTTAVIE